MNAHMNRHFIPCLLLGIVGLGFLGAASGNRYDIASPLDGSRPQRFKNEGPRDSVTATGYITVTTPSGEYITDRREVTSLSAHTYEIEGGMRVWEVTLSERSANTIRWYYTKALPVEPVTAGSPSDEGTGGKLDTLDGKKSKAAPAANADPESKLKVPVRKSYPGTTHAHTVEFRTTSLQQLDELYAYLCLMVYGWSPKHERPVEARKIYPFTLEEPAWGDWDNEKDH